MNKDLFGSAFKMTKSALEKMFLSFKALEVLSASNSYVHLSGSILSAFLIFKHFYLEFVSNTFSLKLFLAILRHFQLNSKF